MSTPRVGILVGHYGKGTGASLGERDEFSLCSRYADRLYRDLAAEERVLPFLLEVDRDRGPWKYVNRVVVSRLGARFLAGRGNIDVRAEWARDLELDVALEIHLNRFHLNFMGVRKAVGFEVFIRGKTPAVPSGASEGSRRFGACIIKALGDKLGSRNRGLKVKSFRILRKLDPGIPAVCLVEPAFLVNDDIVSREWLGRYVDALRGALYQYLFNEEG